MNSDEELLDLYEKRVDKYIKEKQKNDDLYDYITRLEERIDKAICYLKSDNYWLSQVKANDELLDILKGSDKE